MDFFTEHKQRQREQNTWSWIEHGAGNERKVRNNGVDINRNNTPVSGDCPSSSNGETIKTQQGDPITDQMKPCCCETLDTALVTIDILRSKLVGLAALIATNCKAVRI